MGVHPLYNYHDKTNANTNANANVGRASGGGGGGGGVARVDAGGRVSGGGREDPTTDTRRYDGDGDGDDDDGGFDSVGSTDSASSANAWEDAYQNTHGGGGGGGGGGGSGYDGGGGGGRGGDDRGGRGRFDGRGDGRDDRGGGGGGGGGGGQSGRQTFWEKHSESGVKVLGAALLFIVFVPTPYGPIGELLLSSLKVIVTSK